MKFDFIIGNPPYQEETSQKSELNGQKARKNIFQHFQMQTESIGDCTVLIYPGGRWLHQSGKGLKQFGLKQINDCHLSKVIFYPNAKELFPNTDISDGITIVIKNSTKKEKGFEYMYVQNGKSHSVHMENPGSDLIPLNPKDLIILNKIDHFVKEYKIRYLHNYILPRSLFAIESDFVEKNPEKVKEYIESTSYELKEKIKIFTNDKAGAAGRCKWFIANKDIIKQNNKYISEWQVVVSSAHAGGQEGRDRQMTIIDNHSAFGRSRVALGSFATEQEAKNFYTYANTVIIKYAFLMTDEALSSLGKKVPDIVNYSYENKLINFYSDVNSQLAKMIGFSKDELCYIEQCVAMSERKNK